MDGYGDGDSIKEFSKLQDVKPFGVNSTESAVFDASQYAFFGNDAVEEVELGGLDDEEDDLAPVVYEEEEFHLGDALESVSKIDDLSSTFSKLPKVVSGPRGAGVSGAWASRESSSATEWVQEEDFIDGLDQRAFNAEATHESRKWSLEPYPAPHFAESKLLGRTSSYPEQQQQHPHELQNLHHCYSSEPVHIPKSSFTSYPPPGGHQMPISSPNQSPFSNSSHLQLNCLPRAPQFGGNLPELPLGLPVSGQLQNRWMNQSFLHIGNRPSIPNNVSHQQLPHQDGLTPSQMMLPQQSGRQHPSQPSFGQFSGLRSQLINTHLSPAPAILNNFDKLGLPDLSDPRALSMLRSQQGLRYPHHSSDPGMRKVDSGWPRFRSKYMTAEELEHILRMQLAATHSNDPYVDDYYHQACLAKKSTGAKLKHHFCPTNLMDSSTRAHASNEPHAFLQVDALGRVSFSSIRRPRPLLEVDSKELSDDGVESKPGQKSLEQEPMLAARVTIEDGICLLLNVADIDRFLEFNQLPDSGASLRQRRQVLLEGLASSLQLVDPLGKNGHTVDLAPKDDHVFLRIVSLPKGRKLLLMYLQLLLPGELIRVVCMAIFRHLRFFFGIPHADLEANLMTRNLANTVSSCVNRMELKPLAACLASVVCSTEHPPLRPVGSPAGDGASVVLKSVLDRATEVLTDPHASGSCSAPSRAFWQASFDAFFGLLTKYCFNKYDSVMQTFLTLDSPKANEIGPDVAKAISREMPVELLRGSLPHTNEQQKKLLLEFAQRSMPLMGTGGQHGGSG